jgi:glycosyltransferase involved in cell wall biosynthesis
VGDGPERERLSREYPQLIFPGCLSKADLAEHYASADIFVFPSTTETFGNVVTEALTSGLPVVAYDYAAPSEYIEPGRNGYLSTLGNEDSLSSNLDKILRLSGLNLATMGREARASTKPADWKKIIGRFHRDLVEATRELPNFNLHQPSEPTCIEAHA